MKREVATIDIEIWELKVYDGGHIDHVLDYTRLGAAHEFPLLWSAWILLLAKFAAGNIRSLTIFSILVGY